MCLSYFFDDFEKKKKEAKIKNKNQADKSHDLCTQSSHKYGIFKKVEKKIFSFFSFSFNLLLKF